MSPDDPEGARALREDSPRVEELHAELLDAYRRPGPQTLAELQGSAS